MRRVGFVNSLAESDPEVRKQVTAFRQMLQQLGWTEGQNFQVEYRWGAGDGDRIRKNAAEMAALAPDVVLASGASVPLMLQATQTVPTVFVLAIDPVADGLVNSLAHPGGNATGFTLFEFSLSGKWLELLKDAAPSMTRMAVVRDSGTTNGIGQLAALQAAAASRGVELQPIGVRDVKEIENGIASIASASNGGLIVTASASAGFQRDLIIRSASMHRLPAIYFARYFVTAGGLMSYGADFVDQFRRAAVYVDRILRGEKPANLPVQHPTKYELVINLKTAKSLGITFPQPILQRAERLSNEAAGVHHDFWRHGDLAANCRPKFTAGRNEFSGAKKRNNTGAGQWPSRRVGSSHDPADRHDGCTKSHADEGALSQALSAARASRRSHWYAGARSLLQDARLYSEGGTHSCRRDRVYRRLQPMVGMVRAASRGAARSARYGRRALGVARYVTE
jgi:putative tryptophan/tyrosine transport system substrate-binding protein